MEHYRLMIMGVAAIAVMGVFLALPIHAIYAEKSPTGDAGGGGQQTNSPTGKDPSKYLSNLYIWLLGFVGISALFAFVFGGVLYMFSGPNITSTQNAKKWIWNGILGLVIAASSFILLEAINPDLVTHGFDINKMIQDAIDKAGGGQQGGGGQLNL